MDLDLTLSKPQNHYLTGLTTKFKAYVGGYGSGKTFIACVDLVYFAIQHRKLKQGYFGPTYPSIRDVFYPTIEEAAAYFNVKTVIKYGDREVDLFINDEWIGTIICRSMEHPHTIVGFKIVRGVADEMDILSNDKAKIAWQKIAGRLRQKVDGVINGLAVTSTPEGFGFVYERFKKNPTKSYSMVQASSYKNIEHLPDDYIDSLLETYPENLAQAYIHGQFVNLKSGTVYSNFDRKLNHTNRVYQKGEVIYVGMDFNVNQMSAIIHVKDNGEPRAVDEIVNAFDTPAMIRILKERYPDTTIRVYPDASGKSRKSVDASKSDIALLEQAGFRVIANKSNPFVKDRVMAMQRMFKDNNDKRRYLVNVDKCPTLADNLEQQIYTENGEPDKSAKKDHTNDAAGYFIAYEYPIVRPVHNLKVKFSY